MKFHVKAAKRYATVDAAKLSDREYMRLTQNTFKAIKHLKAKAKKKLHKR